MKNLILFALMLLFCAAFNSCLPEVTLTDTEENIVTEPEEIRGSAFSYGTQSFRPHNAYLRTVPASDGENYVHTLVISGEGILLRDGDLTGNASSGVAAVSFISGSESPEGSFSVLPEGAPMSEAGVLLAGAHSYFYFETSDIDLAHRQYESGMLSIVSDGREYNIEVDLTGPDHALPIAGKFVGAITKIELPEVAPVTADDFTGASGFTRDNEEFGLSNAYLVGTNDYFLGKRKYKLFVTEQPADDGNGNLTGTTNTMLMYVYVEEGIKSGRYTLPERGVFVRTGYFSGRENDKINSGYLCRNMDFDLETMDDDEPMEGGEAIIMVEDDQFKIKFTYESTRGATVKGEYQGSILEAR